MHVPGRLQFVGGAIDLLGSFTLLAGVAGMAISIVFLASADLLDVVAGASGFVAGSVLAAAGLISIAVAERRPRLMRAREAELPIAPALDVEYWLAHFQRNRTYRREPDWRAPITLRAEVVPALVRSL